MPRPSEKTIRIPKPYSAVEVRANTFNEESRTVEVCWTAGTRVKRYSWDEGYYMEELAVDKKAIRMDRFASMSLLDTHEQWSMESRLGTVVPGSVKIEGGRGYATIKFSRNDKAEVILRDLQDGHPINISVGYKIHRYEKTEGSDGQLPVLRAIDWEPLELSVVPVPADAEAISRSEPTGKDVETVLVREHQIEAAEPAPISETKPMNKRNAAKTFTGAQLDALAIGAGLARNEGEADDALRTRVLAEYDAEDAAQAAAIGASRQSAAVIQAAADQGVIIGLPGTASERAALIQGLAGELSPALGLTEAQVEEATRRAVEAERGRVTEITTLARTAHFTPEDDFVRAAIDGNTTIEAFRAKVLEKMVERQSQSPTFPHVDTRGMQDAQETTRRMVANAILHRSGVVSKLEDGAREWRSMSTMDIVKELMHARGESTRGSVHDVAARGMHSTSDFPIILQDITTQVVMASYSGYENTFQLFASQKTLSDYRENKLLDIGSAPDLKLKNEHGEFESGTLREGDEAMQLKRYGRKIGFTHEMLVNDQLNAFMDIVSKWGLKVAKLEGDIVWGAIVNNIKLKNGKGIFHADHKNLAAAGSALDIPNLKAARLAFRQQKDLDGERIAITPKYLFTGSALEIDAQTLITSITNPAQVGDVVPQAIKSLVPVYEQRLDDIATKAWFLFADQQQAMGRGIHYLNLLGHETPTTAERIGFDVEGIEFTIAHSFGVGVSDYRFAYKNPGVN